MGLGITSNLRSIAAISNSELTTDSVLQSSWLVCLILLQIDYWFTIWGQSNREIWTIVGVIIFFSIPMALYLAGELLSQAIRKEEDYPASRRKAAKALLLWFSGVMASFGYFVGFVFWPEFHAAVACAFVLLLVAALTHNRRVEIGVGTLFFFWVVYFVLLSGRNEIAGSA